MIMEIDIKTKKCYEFLVSKEVDNSSSSMRGLTRILYFLKISYLKLFKIQTTSIYSSNKTDFNLLKICYDNQLNIFLVQGPPIKFFFGKSLKKKLLNIFSNFFFY